MNAELSDKVIMYHYTNPQAYRAMKTGGRYNEPKLQPLRALLTGPLWPLQAYRKATKGLLEPEPERWINNPNFPHLWRYLMNDLLQDELMLISCELTRKDKAFVLDRAHIERELYKEAKGQGTPTRRSMAKAYKDYWNSKVPPLKYEGNYVLPHFAVFSIISFDRLKVEWIKSEDDVIKQIQENNW